MNWEAVVTLLTLGVILYALSRNSAAPDVLFISAAAWLMSLSLLSDRFPTPRESAAAFGNEGLLTVAVLYIVAAGLTETGGLALIAEKILGRPKGTSRAQLRMMLPVTGVSSVLNNTPVVAMFLPVIDDWCRRHRIPAQKMLIPLAYAATLGGMCTLIGTSTNLVVRGFMEEARKTDPTMPVFGMWTISPVGVPVAIVAILAILLLAPKLLPNRTPDALEKIDPREYTIEMLVLRGGAVDGLTIEQAGLRNLPGAYLIEIQRPDATLVAVGPQEVLRGDDRLIFVGIVDSVVDLQKIRGLVPATDQVFKLNVPRHDRCLIEAVVSSTSPAAGQTVRAARFRTHYDAAVLAVQRGGRRVAAKVGDIVLEPGDVLLLEAHPRFLEQHRHSRDFLLVSAVAGSTPKRHENALVALGIVGALVLAMAFESVLDLSVFNVALIGALLMIVTRCCSVEQARNSIEWPTLIAIGSSFVVGRAMEKSGAADVVANGVLSVFSTPALGAWGAMAGIYVLTLLFTEIVTNNAAAALAFPIAYATAQGLDVNMMPFAMAIAIAASAGFAVPSGYATYLMVHGAGGYRVSDWLRIGLPLDLIVMAVSVALIPVFFPF